MQLPGTDSQELSSGRKPAAALPRDVAEFLVEFSIALHNRSTYPQGHPQLRRAADRFARRLELLLEARGPVSLGVAHRQLLVDGAATDPQNALLRDLSERLHRHQLTAIRFEPGVSLSEIDDLVGALAADPLRGEGPLGRRIGGTLHWPHLRLSAVEYDKLALRGAEPTTALDGARDGASLWVDLARLALGADGAAESSEVARAIDANAGEVAYDRVVLEYLTRIAEEMSGRVSPAEEHLRRRVSDLVNQLDPATLKRLLAASTDQSAARQFTLDASQVLAVDAVVAVLEAAAGACGQTISHQLLRLLHKLAHHAEQGALHARPEAAGVLRQQVSALAAGWQLDDPNPSAYTAVLDQLVQSGSVDLSTDVTLRSEPEDVLRIGLEIGSAGSRVLAAVDTMLARGDVHPLLDLLAAAPPHEATDILWQRVATPERLRDTLHDSPCDRALVERLAERLGAAALPPLLDALAAREERGARAWLLRVLAGLGLTAATAAIERLPGAPWFVQRNLLLLLGRIGEWPEGFSPLPYARESHPAVRREAVKLGLSRPVLRTETVLTALGDSDQRVVTLALRAACEDCPPDAVSRLEAIATDGRRDREMRARAVRALGGSRTPTALERLLELALTRRRWLPSRLAPKSPEVLAAVSSLAAFWSDDPGAAKVVAMARRHADPAFQAAVGPAQS
ncbi:MAG TPA: HEAT repeat domain-containing protein [Gemmatimonadales bacterium]|nr:HEAT repeat domain-containing protein [Gemmatimonadales bacterium]